MISCMLVSWVTCLQKHILDRSWLRLLYPLKVPKNLLGQWNELISDRSLTSLLGNNVFPDTFLLLENIITNNCDWIKPLIIRAAMRCCTWVDAQIIYYYPCCFSKYVKFHIWSLSPPWYFLSEDLLYWENTLPNLLIGHPVLWVPYGKVEPISLSKSSRGVPESKREKQCWSWQRCLISFLCPMLWMRSGI